jgi:hypothetical protein
MPEVQQKDEKKDEPNQSADHIDNKIAEGGNEVEEQARRSGWTPKDEFQGDPDKWVDAKEWIGRAPLYDDMRRLRRKARVLESTVNDLKKHYERVEQTAYQRAVEELKAEKLKALEEGNHRRVVEVDDELDQMRNKKPAPTGENKVDPAFQRWVDQNEWYERDTDMREYADFVGVRFAHENPEKTPEQVFEYVSRQIQKHPEFKERFPNPARERPSSVEGGKSKPAKSATPRWSDLPEHIQKAGDKFVRQGVMTREQYIADLIKIGELKV